jgi:hypothetical protein
VQDRSREQVSEAPSVKIREMGDKVFVGVITHLRLSSSLSICIIIIISVTSTFTMGDNHGVVAALPTFPFASHLLLSTSSVSIYRFTRCAYMLVCG